MIDERATFTRPVGACTLARRSAIEPPRALRKLSIPAGRWRAASRIVGTGPDVRSGDAPPPVQDAQDPHCRRLHPVENEIPPGDQVAKPGLDVVARRPRQRMLGELRPARRDRVEHAVGGGGVVARDPEPDLDEVFVRASRADDPAGHAGASGRKPPPGGRLDLVHGFEPAVAAGVALLGEASQIF